LVTADSWSKNILVIDDVGDDDEGDDDEGDDEGEFAASIRVVSLDFSREVDMLLSG
jgi:hypothetical protein